jgi:2-desacetyl-2-hydroxyethyl bacteriochlorophyllide A dehydrogenase
MPHAITFQSVNDVKVVEFELDPINEGQSIVFVEHSVISPGTELRCLAGKQPNTVEWGFVPGYTCAGYLENGKRVFCTGTQSISLPRMWGGHVSHAIVKTSDLIDVPDNVDTVTAPIARLAAIALRGVNVSQPQPGERVVVIGLGVIGQLSSRLFALQGADVIAFDTDPKRVEIANLAGVKAFLVEGPLVEAVKAQMPQGAEIAVEATGVPAIASMMHQLLAPLPWGDSGINGRKVVFQASYPTEIALNYQDFFSYESNLFFPRDCRPADIRYCLELLGAGKLIARDLISEVLSVSEAASAYAKLINRVPGYLTAAFAYQH